MTDLSINSISKREMRNAILYRIYAEMKFNVVPINSESKSACEKWERWQTDRVPGHIVNRWCRGEFYNKCGIKWKLKDEVFFAMLTGARPWATQPGIVVIDCDDAEAVALATTLCPATPMAQTTPSGGRHLVYRRPAGESCPTRLKTVIHGKTYNIDTKADGGYVLMPGAFSRKRGTSYVWDSVWSNAMLMKCPVYSPEWIPDDRKGQKSDVRVDVNESDAEPDYFGDLDRCRIPYDIRIAQAKHYLSKCPGTVQSQSSGADAYFFATTMAILWGYLIPIDDAVDLLVEWGNRDDNTDSAGSFYGWTWKEVNNKVRGAINKSYRGVPGDMLRQCKGVALMDLEERVKALFN